MSDRLRRLLSRPLGEAARSPSPPPDRDLVARVARLEQMVEDLQDAVYRQAKRVDAEFAELRRLAEPDDMARRLSEDARRRGI